MAFSPSSSIQAEYWKIGLGAVLAGQSMALSLGLNVAKLGPDCPWYYALHGGLLVGALVVMVLLGGPLFQGALQGLRDRRIRMESLFSLSLLGALASSCLSTFYTHGPIYYEVVIIVCLIHKVGTLIRNYAKDKASQEAKRLQASLSFAHVRVGSERRQVPLGDLSLGAVVSIIAGDVIPVDGIISSGEGFVEQSALTGEPGPIFKSVGDRVLAGSYSLDASFLVSITALPPQRLIDSILQAVEGAKLVPSLLEKKAQALVGYFVPTVLFVWLFTLIYWSLQIGWVEGLFNSMCVLLVACPCALGLATPLAVYSGLYGLAQLGLVSKKGYVLDILAKATTLVFDKTGTLTAEDLGIRSWTTMGPSPVPEEDLAGLLALVQQEHPHPIAKAFTKAYQPSADYRVVHTASIPGKGISATVERLADGRTFDVLLGTQSLIPHSKARGSPILAQGPDAVRKVYLFLDAKPITCIDLAESLRKDTRDSIRSLQALGLKIAILSGDPSPTFHSLEGIDLQYGLSPTDKLAAIQALRAQGETLLYLGDGLNDVPAMNLCQASVAMDHGSPLAQYSADGVLLGGKIQTLVEAISLARRLYQKVVTNYYIALAYNTLGLGFAAAGLLNPVGAAGIMLVSSMTVGLRACTALPVQSRQAREN